MKLQILPILLIVAVLGSCVEGYAYYSSAGRDMYEKTEATSLLDDVLRIEANHADILSKILDNTARIMSLERIIMHS